MPLDHPPIIVIGIGNADRGDDGAGRAVARALRRMIGEDGIEIEIVELDGEATALLSLLENRSEAYLIDASASGAPCGAVLRFDVAAASLPCEARGFSTHGFGLAEAIELARVLGHLPPRCIVFAMEGRCFERGAQLSAEVETAVYEVARRIFAEISPERAVAPSY